MWTLARVGVVGWLVLAAGTLAAQEPPPIELDGSIDGHVGFDAPSDTWTIDDAPGGYSPDGSSLFHSFGRFSVPSTDLARFTADDGVPSRVFARVTWGEPSAIDGGIEVAIPGASFYLLNPAGVSFGSRSNVRLDQGSFYATTAAVVHFSEGGSFEADAASPPSIVEMEHPAAFGFLDTAAPIEFASRGAGITPLAVDPDQTIAVIGGDITLSGGTVFHAPGARIALVAAGPGIEVPHELDAFEPAGVDDGVALGAVTFDGADIFAAPSPNAGSILLRGGSLAVENGSRLLNFHRGESDSSFPYAVDAIVRGDLTISGSTVQAGSLNAGHGGDIRLRGRNVSIVDTSVDTSSFNDGVGSDIEIAADELLISGSGLLQSLASGSQDGGAVRVTAHGVSVVDGGQINTVTDGEGTAGSIAVTAERLLVEGQGPTRQSRVLSEGRLGDAGDVVLDVASTEVSNGASIGSATFGRGNAGDLTITGDRLLARGGELGPAEIASAAIRPEGEPLAPLGRGGQLSIHVSQLELLDGSQVTSSSTSLDQPGGNVEVVADRVFIAGVDPASENESGIFAQTRDSFALPSAVGGSISVTATGDVEIRDGAGIAVATRNAANAGNITVAAGGRVELSGGATITAEAQTPLSTGDSGSISVSAGEGVFLSGESSINAEASGSGNAGTIAIDAGPQLVLDRSTVTTEAAEGGSGQVEVVARDLVELTDSSITTSVVDGNGGRIFIAVSAGEGVFLSGGSSINAEASGSGNAGTIAIEAGPQLVLDRSTVTTEAAEGGGGQIEVIARDLVELTDSSITTSVVESGSLGDGGDIRIDPETVVLNRSQILANARDGNGGGIFIVAGAFVLSSGSLVDASSERGIDGEVVIESPDSDLTSQTAAPPQQYLDASGLLRNACTAAGATQSSLVVARVAGLPASPEGPLPSRMWDESWLETRLAAR